MRVAVIGGGYAGLAAAITLAAQGARPILFEAGTTLGGRARAVPWRGLSLDNGQHILLGAYQETLRLMALAGGPPGAISRLPLALAIAGRFEFRAPQLPAPLHLLAGLLRAQGLTWQQRLSAIRFASALKLQAFRLGHDESVATLLARFHQDGETVRLLWEPLCLAALNTPIRIASAQVFLNVLRDSFSHARADSDLILPKVDLTALFPTRACDYILRQGGVILTRTRIRQIEHCGGTFRVKHAAAEESFSHVICATAPQHVASLLGQYNALEHEAALIASLSHQPIATVYFQYPSHVRLAQPMLGLENGPAQWVFDRGLIQGTPGLLAAVISADGPYMSLSQERLAIDIHEQFASAFGLPAPLWHKVIIERRATFSCLAGLQRPQQATALANFYLAGDYTAGDYPATLEGAVRSGVKCAKLILGAL